MGTILLAIVVGVVVFAIYVLFMSGILYATFLLCKIDARYRDLVVYTAVSIIGGSVLVVGGSAVGGGFGFLLGFVVALGLSLVLLRALTGLDTLLGAFAITFVAYLLNAFIGILLSGLFESVGEGVQP